MAKLVQGAQAAAMAARVIADIDADRAIMLGFAADKLLTQTIGWGPFKRPAYRDRDQALFYVPQHERDMIQRFRRDQRNACWNVIKLWENRDGPPSQTLMVLSDFDFTMLGIETVEPWHGGTNTTFVPTVSQLSYNDAQARHRADPLGQIMEDFVRGTVSVGEALSRFSRATADLMEGLSTEAVFKDLMKGLSLKHEPEDEPDDETPEVETRPALIGENKRMIAWDDLH